jgi:hypothetical protein
MRFAHSQTRIGTKHHTKSAHSSAAVCTWRGPAEIFELSAFLSIFAGGTPRAAEGEGWAYRRQKDTRPPGQQVRKNYPIDVLHMLHAARVAHEGSEASKACPQMRGDRF